MISAGGRCNSGGGGRASAMSKDCRIVNGGGGGIVVGGYVNHCEEVLSDQNEMVMAASKIAVVAGNDQTVASISHRVYPPSSNELVKIKDLSLGNLMIIEEYAKTVAMKNDQILLLKREVDNVSDHLKVASSDFES